MYSGTGNTMPFQCFPTDAEFQVFFDEQKWFDSTETALQRIWARAGVDVALCKMYMDKIGPYIGTAFVARDLISVVDALGEDGMLRYWGESRLLNYSGTEGAANLLFRLLVRHNAGRNCCCHVSGQS